jgi:hypothetical protein
VSLALRHPLDKHLVELVVHLLEPFTFFLEKTTSDGVLRAGWGNV